MADTHLSKPTSSIIAIDAGTTGIRAIAFEAESNKILSISYRELTQFFPRPGWVEHDPNEIWNCVQKTLEDVAHKLHETSSNVVAIGITNQRETILAWDRTTGKPLYNAIVWQDRRTTEQCNELKKRDLGELIGQTTGLLIDPYFSASKIKWLKDSDYLSAKNIFVGTVDSWIVWNLTGGVGEGVHRTDPSNASRTMLYDIKQRCWSQELMDLFEVDKTWLAEVCPSSAIIGKYKTSTRSSLPQGVPIAGIAGDQAAALFGQACFTPASAKTTYGTGSFVLMNAGSTLPRPSNRVLTSIAWELDDSIVSRYPKLCYALEGAVFSTGSTIQWLRDGLGIITQASGLESLARQVSSTEGVTIVPAFTGLGCPWWDPNAKGSIYGISKGIGRSHLALAVIESIAFQVRDAFDAMRQVTSFTTDLELRVDGGAAAMELLLQLQSDQLQIPVARSSTIETSALGCAWLAGLGVKLYDSVESLESKWSYDLRVEPKVSKAGADASHDEWLRLVEKTLT